MKIEPRHSDKEVAIEQQAAQPRWSSQDDHARERERDLRESEERYRATFDNAPVGIAHVALDGQFLRINPALCKIVGYTSEALLEKTFADITHAEDLSGDWTLANKVAAGEIESYTLEKRYIRMDGSTVWVNLTVSMMFSADGTPKHFISVVEDISSRKYAEQRLREIEDHYRFMVDKSPQMPWTANATGHMTDFSDGWLETTGLSRDAARDEGWHRVIHPDDMSKMKTAWQHSVDTGEPYDIEHRAKTPDGSYRWMRARAVARRNPAGAIIRWYGSTEDIEKQKHVEENLERLVGQRTAELNRANEDLTEARDIALATVKAKSGFLANMSHEIRTPMNGVIGLTSLLMEMDLGPEAHEMVRAISTSGETLLRIIDEILDLSRMEAGHIDIERAPVDLDQLAADVITLFQGRALAKGIKLTYAAPSAAVPPVLADAVRLRQILSNLISNGIKFTGVGEVVLATTWQSHGNGIRALLSVSDTGSGIPEDRTAAVFDSFTQADGSTQRRFGGSGLGLTISKKLVELMGGSISLTTKLGEGSTFVVELPLEFAAAPVFPPSAEKPSTYGARALRVLLAEDNEINVMVGCRLLAHCGCEVQVAEDGLQAVSLASNGYFDLILMDVQMPVCDGLVATRAIREAEEADQRKRTPIYALSANAMKADRLSCLEAGMDGFLAKPIPLAALQVVLDKCRISPR